MLTISIIQLVVICIIARCLLNQTKKATNIMATIAESLAVIEASLEEASVEIPAELAKLREQLSNVITPEAAAAIERIAAKAKTLADVVPNE